MEEEKEDDAGMDETRHYYVVREDKDGHHVNIESVFMENDWNERNGPMPFSPHNQELQQRDDGKDHVFEIKMDILRKKKGIYLWIFKLERYR